MPANHNEIEKKLWASADELRANSHLKSSEYSVPVLGLIFLRFADQRFASVEQELNATVHAGSRRTIGKADYQAIDWRKKQQAKADVQVTIDEILDRLPACYSKVVYVQLCVDVFQHVYESYFGQGKSVYAMAS
jgi:type I restriction-modification system DNA methylase subunit